MYWDFVAIDGVIKNQFTTSVNQNGLSSGLIHLNDLMIYGKLYDNRTVH
jgi:hypothetical protein